MALESPPSTPRSGADTICDPPSTTFDIASHYTDLTTKDTTLTPAIAAIESLIALLSTNPLTTISETLALISQQSEVLLASQRNPIPLSAGTDLFQRYLVSSFQQRSLHQHSDFTTLRKHLISNSRLFVSRSKQAPKKIAQHGLPFIRDDSTIFTYGTSIAINTLFSHAIDSGRYFTCVPLTSPTCPNPTPPFDASPASTSNPNPSKPLPIHSFTYILSSLPSPSLHTTSVLIPALAVLENGAIISPLGTHQLALLAFSFNIPVYVAVESHNFVRKFPLSCGMRDLRRMGVRQDLLGELTREESDGTRTKKDDEAQKKQISREEEMIEITPPNLITALITENGIMTPAGVSEELIKLWF